MYNEYKIIYFRSMAIISEDHYSCEKYHTKYKMYTVNMRNVLPIKKSTLIRLLCILYIEYISLIT